MRERSGCRGVEPLAELMDEHYALLDEGVLLTEALDARVDRPTYLGADTLSPAGRAPGTH